MHGDERHGGRRPLVELDARAATGGTDAATVGFPRYALVAVVRAAVIRRTLVRRWRRHLVAGLTLSLALAVWAGSARPPGLSRGAAAAAAGLGAATAIAMVGWARAWHPVAVAARRNSRLVRMPPPRRGPLVPLAAALMATLPSVAFGFALGLPSLPVAALAGAVGVRAARWARSVDRGLDVFAVRVERSVRGAGHPTDPDRPVTEREAVPSTGAPSRPPALVGSRR